MKKLAVLLFTFFCCVSGFAKDPEPKTFLVLFKAKELKEYKTSLKQIESQFSNTFKTKVYDGNSELALMIEVPTEELDAEFLGGILVNLGNEKHLQLQEIAFRVFDLSENRELYENYLTLYEESQIQKKKTAKNLRLPSGALGGPGH